MKLLTSTLLAMLLTTSVLGAEKTAAQYLQEISVTIVSENSFSRGEGSGVIFTRKDSQGNLVNYVWTAAHVIDNLRRERKVIVNGSPRTVVEFKDAKIVKVIRQDGRSVGTLEMDAEVIKYSDATDGHDLALLRIRKRDFIKGTVVFHLGEEIPKLGTDLWHVGSLLGQMGSNSMTDGIYSQTGRVIKSLNKHVFDQTTVAAFPGSSGGGVYLKSDRKYIGMLVRGAGETFNLIVPVRRMQNWCEENKIQWALDPKVAMPSEAELKKIPVEDVGADFSKESEDEKAARQRKSQNTFPFLYKNEDKQKPEFLK